MQGTPLMNSQRIARLRIYVDPSNLESRLTVTDSGTTASAAEKIE